MNRYLVMRSGSGLGYVYEATNEIEAISKYFKEQVTFYGSASTGKIAIGGLTNGELIVYECDDGTRYKMPGVFPASLELTEVKTTP